MLRHELSPVSLTLFNPLEFSVSILGKTPNNKLFKLKQTPLGTASMIPMNTTNICDGMFLFEKVKAPLSTFGDIYNFLKQVAKSNCRIFSLCERLLST